MADVAQSALSGQERSHWMMVIMNVCMDPPIVVGVL